MAPTERPLTILVVDDDATLLDVLVRVLKRDGHAVVHANGVAEALEMADQYAPDLALLDLSLPDGDGVILADRLRQRRPDLPLILMTAYPIRAQEDPAIANRFSRVMIKPLNLEELRRAVRESVRGGAAAGASVPVSPSVAAAPSPQPSAAPPAPRPHDRWHWLKSGAMVGVALLVLAAFLLYILGVPIPGLSAGAEATAPPPPSVAAGVTLADGAPHAVVVPEDVRTALGIRKVKKGASGKEVPYDDVYTAKRPTETRPMILTGSTYLDPDKVLHVRVRFTPAKVVRIGPAGQDSLQHEKIYELNEDEGSNYPKPDRYTPGPLKKPVPELRVGDHVHRGDLLAVFYSDAVGSQKNALFDAESQRRLDQEILDRAEASAAAVEVFVLNARRNLEADINHSNQAVNTLRTWGIDPHDIDAIINEAKSSHGSNAQITREQYESWGRVEVRADMDGVLVERNIPQNELMQDPTVSLFQIATVDHIQVIANASEDDLKTLVEMQQKKQKAGEKLQWHIDAVNGPDKDALFDIDDIGYIVDPNQHSAVVKGRVPNPDGKMRGAQIVTASIPLAPPADVVEVDVDAIADDGSGHTYVFVQTDENKSEYTLKRVKVTHRFDKVMYVKSKLDDKDVELMPQEKEQGLAAPEPLREGDKVLTSGVLELKKELEDRESDAAK